METQSCFTLIFVQLSLLGGGKGQDCFEKGECLNSLFVDEIETDGAQGCLEHCQDDPGNDCQYFTYYEDSELCYSFASCEDFSTDTCGDLCYSGRVDCGDLICWESGSCQGNLVDSFSEEEEGDCRERCEEDDDCLWFVHDWQTDACTLLSACSVTASCDTCYYGQKQCTDRDRTKVLLVAGYDTHGTSGTSDDTATDATEVLELASFNDCASIPNYPISTFGPVAAYLEGEVMVCGGSDPATGISTRNCYRYSGSTGVWQQAESMVGGRRHQGASSLQDGDIWYLTGGYDGGTWVQSSEIWENGAFRTGTLIPEPLFNICQLTLEDRDTGDGDKIFIVGDNLRSYLLDWRTQTWTRLPDKSVNGDGPGCGYVRSRENGLEIVVAVSGRSEIFNWDTQTWRAGPDTPSGGYDSQGTSVQQEDNFLILGGQSASFLDLNTVLEFDPISYIWISREETLANGKDSFAAVPVPDSLLDC